MANFEDLIRQEKPVLIDFFATWCGPCKTLEPIIKQVAQKMENQIKVYKIDIDKNPQVAAQWQIRGVPTLILFKDGKIAWRQSGVMGEADLIRVLKGLI